MNDINLDQMCAVSTCNEKGEWSLSLAYGKQYNGLDPHLFFCLPHLKLLLPIYTKYKTIESEHKFILSKSANIEYILKRWNERDRQDLVNEIGKAIQFRMQLQLYLKPDVHGEYHQLWLQHLLNRKEEVEQFGFQLPRKKRKKKKLISVKASAKTRFKR
jgi:hypothetical protein